MENKKMKLLHRIMVLDEMLMLNRRRLKCRNDDSKQPIIDLCIEFQKERDTLEIEYFNV